MRYIAKSLNPFTDREWGHESEGILEPLLVATALLAAIGLYWQFCAVTWDESDRRRLESESLHLAHVLSLLEAPDVRWLMRRPAARKEIVREFSGYLREDVRTMLRRERKTPGLLILSFVFFCSYYAMRVKAMARSGPRDLRFLSGVELTIFRGVVDWRREATKGQG